jgi:hypothetical protein
LLVHRSLHERARDAVHLRVCGSSLRQTCLLAKTGWILCADTQPLQSPAALAATTSLRYTPATCAAALAAPSACRRAGVAPSPSAPRQPHPAPCLLRRAACAPVCAGQKTQAEASTAATTGASSISTAHQRPALVGAAAREQSSLIPFAELLRSHHTSSVLSRWWL